VNLVTDFIFVALLIGAITAGITWITAKSKYQAQAASKREALLKRCATDIDTLQRSIELGELALSDYKMSHETEDAFVETTLRVHKAFVWYMLNRFRGVMSGDEDAAMWIEDLFSLFGVSQDMRGAKQNLYDILGSDDLKRLGMLPAGELPHMSGVVAARTIEQLLTGEVWSEKLEGRAGGG